MIDEGSSSELKIFIKIQAYQAQEHEDGSCNLIKIQAISSFYSCLKLQYTSDRGDLDIAKPLNPLLPLIVLQEVL